MRADDIADQSAIAFGSPFPGVPFHAEVLALDVAQATELLEKRAVRVGNDGMGLCLRMGRAEAHLAEPREAVIPTQQARVSTRASLPNTLLVRSSSRHLGFPRP